MFGVDEPTQSYILDAKAELNYCDDFSSISRIRKIPGSLPKEIFEDHSQIGTLSRIASNVQVQRLLGKESTYPLRLHRCFMGQRGDYKYVNFS